MDNPAKIPIIFWGTPGFAVPSLLALANNDQYQILGVITQPDQPVGRKQIMTPPAVKVAAKKLNLPIWQPDNLKDEKFINQLKKLKPEVMVLVAYGNIVPTAILKIPPKGIINIHPSLLPKYRGPSPIASAVLNGDNQTGLSIMLLDEQMDHGQILAQKKIPIDHVDTQESLAKKLADLGAKLLLNTLTPYLVQTIKPLAQNDAQATFCKIIDKQTGKIDWQKSAQEIERQIRALHPWPGTYTTWSDKTLKIFPPTTLVPSSAKPPGTVYLTTNKELAVTATEADLVINQLQLSGKKILTTKEFISGYPQIINQVLK